MGVLIPMSAFSGPGRSSLPTGESAEILFFTGVRYYRLHDAVEPATAKPVRRRAKAKKQPAPARLDCHA